MKLNEMQVAQVRALARDGKSYAVIALRFGIAKSHVFNIVRFKQRAIALRSLLRASCG